MRGLDPGPTLTDALLTPVLARDPARPLVTYYDDATGERIELSGTTLANWAAKTANLLRDECDLEPGGRVAVLLPAHWQTLAVLLGAWWCGAEVVTGVDLDDPVDVACCDADRLQSACAADVPVVVALSLHALGAGLADLPAGVVDFATEVRAHGDVFTPDGDAGAAVLDGRGAAEVLADARAAAAEAGLTVTSRVLTARDWSAPADGTGGGADGLVEVPLAVLAAGGSLVQCRNLEPGTAEATLDRRATTERVTHRLG
ncbi:TIGR03089 family protein [Pseudonocardia acaciae]|uniref:TIGR03089 family protein n=1 Tax=Pseudonocardia acaciae TaxID=551276 RepID=UPI00048D864B|nr:TIGR03089 family protein [Pseudonocardia acaciae]